MLDSLRTRLALSNLLITLVGVMALTFVFSQLLRQRSEDIQRNDVSQQAVLLRADLGFALTRGLEGAGSPLSFDAYLFHDARILEKRVILFSRGGGCIFDSKVFGHQRQNGLTGPPPCNAASEGWLAGAPGRPAGPLSRFITHHGHQYLVYQEPVKLGGTVVLIADASNVIPAWTTFTGVFVIAAGTAVIVWLLMGLYFAYFISRPLLRITAAANAMAEGDYDQRVEIRGEGEIVQLARRFNHMAAQIKASHQLLKDFVANVSHDLRTPLTLISGYAATVLDGTADTADQARESVEIIAQEAGRMQHLVDDLLQLTSLESGLRRFQPQPMALRPVVERTIRRVTAARDGRSVINDVPSNLPLVCADEELVERALMNLIDNGLQHTPGDGSVAVAGRVRRDAWIEVSVSDTGSGIAVADLDRIFERFYRADRGRSRSGGNAGLGLPIVKEIAEVHGGEVEVESAPGHGATFRFTLPPLDGHEG